MLPDTELMHTGQHYNFQGHPPNVVQIHWCLVCRFKGLAMGGPFLVSFKNSSLHIRARRCSLYFPCDSTLMNESP